MALPGKIKSPMAANGHTPVMKMGNPFDKLRELKEIGEMKEIIPLFPLFPLFPFLLGFIAQSPDTR
jgi:hypothetical protein